jgi:4-amino-4-deoxy-L-arabinose transferase-like glycosyltransferase
MSAEISSTSGSRFRRWTRLIIIAAALLRLSYLASGEVLPVLWDARIYASAALGLISYIDEPAADAASAYPELTEKYISGEQIDWLYYKPHTLAEARDAIFLSGPLYPSCLAVIFAISPIADFTMARLFNVLLDLLCCWFVMKIARRLAGETAAYVAGAIYAIYFPFILCSSVLLLETPTTCLILAAVWMVVSAHDSGQSARRYWLAGLFLGLLILVKPSATLLFAPLALAGYIWLRPRGGVTKAIVMQVAIPVLVILAAWTTVASIRYGQLALRDPNYADANLRQASSVKYDGYDLDKVDQDFWTKRALGDAVDNPVGYLGLLSHKVYRLWARPYNDFDRVWGLPYSVSEWVHLLTVLAGVVGFSILARRSMAMTAIPLAIILYYTALHAVFLSLSRYNVSAMPMMMIGAGFAAQLFLDGWQKHSHSIRLIVAGTATALIAIILPTLVDLFGIASPAVGLTAITIGQLALASLAVWVFLSIANVSVRERLMGASSIGAVALLFYVPFLTHYNRYAEFSAQIRDASTTCGTRIFVPQIEPVGNDEFLALMIDMTSGGAENGMFLVSIGNQSMEFPLEQSPLVEISNPRGVYAIYARLEGIKKEEFRQWAVIPMDYGLVQSELIRQGFVEFRVSGTTPSPIEGGQFNVYGRSDIGDDRGTLPSVRQTGVERWVFEGDPRMPFEERFLSDSAVSFLLNSTNTEIKAGQDLSEALGLQSGRYHMYLMHFKTDKTINIY